MENNPSKKQVLRVEVSGKDPQLWKELRGKLMAKIAMAVYDLLDVGLDPIARMKLENGAREVSTAFLKYQKSAFDESSIEKQQIFADIGKKYAETEREKATAREKNAQAQTVELGNAIKALKIALGATQMMMYGEEGEEVVVFSKQLASFMEVLKEMEGGVAG